MTPSTDSQKRVALIVGSLTGEELKAGNRDVTHVHSLLLDPEFGSCSSKSPKPILECEAKTDFQEAIDKLLDNWQIDSQLIFYFTGHGVISRGGTYCLQLGPTNKDLLPFDNLLNDLKRAGVQRAILILDTCYAGAAARVKTSKTLPELENYPLPSGIAVIASSRASESSEELPDGSASVFTQLFCQGIETGLDGKYTHDGKITVEDIVSYVTEKLVSDKRYIDYPQRPRYRVEDAEKSIWISNNRSGSFPSKEKGEQAPNQVTSPEELRLLYEKTLSTKHPCPNVENQDLDWELVKEFWHKFYPEERQSPPEEDILTTLHLYSPIPLNGKLALHKSAVLCFAKRPELFYDQARSVFVIGEPGDINFVRKDVTGPLSQQVQTLVKEVYEKLSEVSYIAQDGRRQTRLEIDRDVVRELISNAIAHRNYDSSGTVSVSLTSDALEVRSPGTFPSGTSWKEFLDCGKPVSCPVDAAISHFLANLLVYEGIGRGFDIFKKYINENGDNSINCHELPGPVTLIRVLRRASQTPDHEPSYLRGVSYDVFLSHNSEDKADVENIARRLRDEHGLKVWLDKWNLIPGKPWQEELENGLNESETIAVFLGESGFGKWKNEEMRVAIEACVSDSSRRVMAILLPGASDSALSMFFRRLTWVDFRSGLDDKTAFHNLVCGIRGISPGDTVSESRLPRPEILPEPGAILPGWRVPNYRNAMFTGREDDLKALAKALLNDPQKTHTAVPQVITGMIGIGKTQLAVEFCYRYGRYFRGVHWINAQQDIDGEIAACGAEMQLPFWPETTTEQLRVTLRAWQNDGPRLLILDSVEGPELLHKWLPTLSGFRLLLTTRHHYWPPDLGVQTYHLDLLSLPESLALLRKSAPRLKEAPDAELENVAKKLGNLPLALYLAGRYLDESKTLTPQGYLKELDDLGGGLEHTSLLDGVEGESPTGHETNLVRTFLLIWQQLNEEKPLDSVARQIFLACGYCAPNIPIPDKIIYRIVEGKERIADRALSRLYNLGLLTKDIVINQLLAEFARHQDSDKQSLGILVDVLTRLSYEANTTGLPTKFFPLRPHVEAAVYATESANMKTVVDDLWGNLGTHYRIVAEFGKAEYAAQQALAKDEEIFGPENTKTALRLINLGRVLHVEGKLDGAKQHYERALAIDEEALGPNHPTVALSLNNLGNILRDLGDLKGAKEKIDRALAIDEKASGPNDPNVARDNNILGLILKDMYELPSALKAFERARDIDEAAFGPNDPNVARDINNIGWILKDIGNFKEALELFNRARAIDEEAYGPIHPTVARDISNIGCVLKDQGKLHEANENFKVALTLFKKVYHPNHPEVANILNHIGELLKSDGKLEEAKQRFECALVIDEKVYGPEHPAFARDLYNLGIVLKDLGEVEPAKQFIKRALAIYEKSLPGDHPLVLVARENLEILGNQANPNSTQPL